MYIDDMVKRLNKLSENQKKMYDYGYLLGVITGKVYQKQIRDCEGESQGAYSIFINCSGINIRIVPYSSEEIQYFDLEISKEELETLVAIVKEMQAEEEKGCANENC